MFGTLWCCEREGQINRGIPVAVRLNMSSLLVFRSVWSDFNGGVLLLLEDGFYGTVRYNQLSGDRPISSIGCPALSRSKTADWSSGLVV